MLSLPLLVLKFLLSIVIYLLITVSLIITVTLIIIKAYNSLTKGKCKSKTRLDGKVALITGGNSGIGYETAKNFAKRGAKVIIASRNVAKSARAVQEIIDATGNENVEQRYLDLARFSSVKKFAKEFNESFNRLDILVNNSGVAGMRHKLTEDEIDIVTQINYFGPFLLTNLLMDKMIASRPSRIIIVSSKVHSYATLRLEDLKCQTKTHWFTVYANTKLLNVLWAKALAKQVSKGVTVNVLHPGVVQTEIFDKFGPNASKIVLGIIGAIFKTAEEGAQTTIHLAVSDEVEYISGRYFVDCQLCEESKNAQNEDFINEVWEKSIFITKSGAGDSQPQKRADVHSYERQSRLLGAHKKKILV